MNDYRDIIKNRELRLKIINCLGFLPDEPYLKMVYRIKTGRKLNLNNPIGFNEKLNWLKIHDIHPEYTNYADKVAVKKIVEDRIGPGYTFPLLGVWNKFEDIDFDRLPDRFVLKCTHDSGSVKIIKDKGNLKYDELNKFYHSRLKINAYNIGREYPYKDIPRKIMAEEYVVDENGNTPNDYKFFCFDGEPQFMFVATDREKDVTHTLFDMNFNRLSIQYIHRQVDYELNKPETFDEMKDLARKLSKGIKFVRIDFYEIDKKVYFGEYTFFPAGGFWLMKPDEWEYKLGALIKVGGVVPHS